MQLTPLSLTPGTAAALKTKTPLLWLNPDLGRAVGHEPSLDSVSTASDRFERSRALLATLFPEMKAHAGVVDSPLVRVPDLQAALGIDPSIFGEIYLKADHLLSVAGSIKARGGFHEVLAHAESIAVSHGLMAPGDDLIALASPEARDLFKQRTIAVGSTGNLGLSIGIMSAALGFSAVVHMSNDAKAWKKSALRDRGVKVVEHEGDYAKAVEAGRVESTFNPLSYFVDDESSSLLFLGYAAASVQLAHQLAQAGRTPSASQPLFIYLPCGVGGAPGGITYGLKALFGKHVHCFFAEPVASPCMLAQLACGLQHSVSVYDFGLDNRTQADGLAVPCASPMVAALMSTRVSGIFTVTDEQLFAGLLSAWKQENIALEPSAAAGFCGPQWLQNSEAGQRYIEDHQLAKTLAHSTHVLWSTGGGLLPLEEHERFRDLAVQSAA